MFSGRWQGPCSNWCLPVVKTFCRNLPERSQLQQSNENPRFLLEGNDDKRMWMDLWIVQFQTPFICSCCIIFCKMTTDARKTLLADGNGIQTNRNQRARKTHNHRARGSIPQAVLHHSLVRGMNLLLGTTVVLRLDEYLSVHHADIHQNESSDPLKKKREENRSPQVIFDLR